MPSLITTVEENSPLITFVNGWVTGVSANDDQISKYSDSSFMATQTPGASASFVFSGTGVQIFGAKRSNHGGYLVKVDDTIYPAMDGKGPDAGLYQQNLFSVDNLNVGRHEVTITNQGTTFLDIDFITWTTEIGGSSDKLFVSTFQDDDPSFAYSSSWNTNPKNIGSFSGGSGHATNSAGASFVYTFQVSEGISLYGLVGPEGSPYTAQLDSEPARNLTSNKDLYQPQVLLYHANNLPSGKHTLRVTCQPAASGQVLSVDYANVYSTSPLRASQSGLSAGSIAGIVLSIVGVIGVLVGLFVFLRRRQRRLYYQDELNAQPITGENSASENRQGVVTISSFGPGPRTGETRFIPTPFMIETPAVPDLNSGSGSPSRAAAEKYHLRFSDLQEGSSSNHLTSDRLNEDRDLRPVSISSTTTSEFPLSGRVPRQPQVASQRKGQLPPLPRTAGLALVGTVPEATLRETRRVVNGRAQDFGSSPTDTVSSGSPFSDTEFSQGHAEARVRGGDRKVRRDNDELLPPDYTQATQPYNK